MAALKDIETPSREGGSSTTAWPRPIPAAEELRTLVGLDWAVTPSSVRTAHVLFVSQQQPTHAISWRSSKLDQLQTLQWPMSATEDPAQRMRQAAEMTVTIDDAISLELAGLLLACPDGMAAVSSPFGARGHVVWAVLVNEHEVSPVASASSCQTVAEGRPAWRPTDQISADLVAGGEGWQPSEGEELANAFDLALLAMFQARVAARPKAAIACAASGVMLAAFRAVGWDATSYDTRQCERADLEAYHVVGDVRDAAAALKECDCMVATPDCTYLSNAGARYLWAEDGPESSEDRYEKLRKAAAEIVWLYHLGVPLTLIENAVMNRFARAEVGLRWAFKVQPYEHGHAEVKPMCFYSPTMGFLRPTQTMAEREKVRSQLWPSEDRWIKRSRAYEGVAAALAVQCGVRAWRRRYELENGVISGHAGHDRARTAMSLLPAALPACYRAAEVAAQKRALLHDVAGEHVAAAVAGLGDAGHGVPSSPCLLDDLVAELVHELRILAPLLTKLVPMATSSDEAVEMLSAHSVHYWRTVLREHD
jgi:hypothetical protein